MTGAAALDALREESRRRPGPPLRPGDAATLIVLDREGPAPRVLMGRRHAAQRFMPGKFVFPGGRVDPGDARAAPSSPLPPAVAARLLAGAPATSPARARALAAAALRETFEETGLAVGAPPGGPAPRGAAPPGWAAFLALAGAPALDGLDYVARAVTPPGRPRRFDARFFTVDAARVTARREGVVGPDAELTELAWVDLDEARRLDLPAITRVVLDELAARLGAGSPPGAPVPHYRERGGRFVREVI